MPMDCARRTIRNCELAGPALLKAVTAKGKCAAACAVCTTGGYGNGAAQSHRLNQRSKTGSGRRSTSQDPSPSTTHHSETAGTERFHATNHAVGTASSTSMTRHVERAHRLAWEIVIGPIPDGLVLDHLCRRPVCVNPSHLEPVTDAENLRRAAVSRRLERAS